MGHHFLLRNYAILIGRLLGITILCSTWSVAVAAPEGRTYPYETCTSSAELLKYESIDLNVHFATSNPELAMQFKNAMNFWATVIDMQWHADSSSPCGIQLLDGKPELFADSTIAKAYQGGVAFNPRAPLTSGEFYLTSVHEIGHLLGLKHNENVTSVMYYTNYARADLLDGTDLQPSRTAQATQNYPDYSY